MTLGSRIKEKRKARGLIQKQVADHFGITGVSVSEWERDLSRPDSAKLDDLARLLRTSVDYLLSGRETKGAGRASTIEPGPDIRGTVPLISWVQAGQWAEISKNFDVCDAEDWIPCPAGHSKDTFCLRVRGQSMFNPNGAPSFSEGEVIFVDPDRGAGHRSCVIVRLDDEREATFKQLIIEGDKKLLHALNPSWPEQWIYINGNATIMGTVIGKWVPV
ncbi:MULTISPECIES: LexA family protein [Burkholderia cepacia complex]|uniref:LexA family protein n=1 Tax=Burkholderia cepacia complex TaxID=87882 RepID=UPI001CF1A55E|nr:MULTISPECIES: S24 family peptidase [Burkholderia cepacia complex]MCA8323258.1 helix-turn-helix domain-containing protein [Burkholderia cepacia]MDN7848099.1 S24 family peptidase [Burkholderia seminalis]